MQIKKAYLIYGLSLVLILALMFFENSTFLFSMHFQNIEGLTLKMLPDLLSIAVLTMTYLILKIFYKKSSVYRKSYPAFALLVIIIWTIGVQLK
jgi:hypothetical protein